MPSSAWVGRRGPANRAPTASRSPSSRPCTWPPTTSTARTTSDAVTAPVPGAPARLEGVLTTPSSTVLDECVRMLAERAATVTAG